MFAAADYQGTARLLRLLHVVRHGITEERKATAKSMFYDHLISSNNTTLYKQNSSLIDSRATELEEWAKTVDLKMGTNLASLESKLLHVKSSTIKESIRQVYMEMGQLYQQWGKLEESLKCYLRSRDYCSTTQHHLECAFNIITTSMNSEQRYNALNFVNKIHEITAERAFLSKANCIHGVLALVDRQYSLASTKFLCVDCSLEDEFSDTITGRDVALYSSLCFLITLNRVQLADLWSSHKAFVKLFLNLDMPLKSFLQDISAGKYHEVQRMLEFLNQRIQEDYHLCDRRDEITSLIMDQLLVEYLKPYDLVPLVQIAESFGMELKALEDRIINMISAGKLGAKINSLIGTVSRLGEDDHVSALRQFKLLIDSNSYNLVKNVIRCRALAEAIPVDSIHSEDNKRLFREQYSDIRSSNDHIDSYHEINT